MKNHEHESDHNNQRVSYAKIRVLYFLLRRQRLEGHKNEFWLKTFS